MPRSSLKSAPFLQWADFFRGFESLEISGLYLRGINNQDTKTDTLGGGDTMTKDKLAQLRAKITAQDLSDAARKDLSIQIQRATQSEKYSSTVWDALLKTGNQSLATDMLDCGEWESGNRQDCRSLYCGKKDRHKAYKDNPSEPVSCYKKITEPQDALMKTVLTRYPTDKEQRDNLRSVTILFAAFGYDLDGNDNPALPMYTLKDKAHPRGTLAGTVIKAKQRADRQLKTLSEKFPDVAWLGGYSWEAQHSERLGGKKKESLKALKTLADKDMLISRCQQTFITPATEPWRKHHILFHAHLVVDLRGTSHQTFRDYCHKIWGTDDNKKRPVPDGVLVKRFKEEEYKKVPDSLKTLAQYPFRNQWKYKFKYSGTDEDGNTDDTVYPDITLEPEILSALVQGLTTLNKKTKIVLNNQWDE